MAPKLDFMSHKETNEIIDIIGASTNQSDRVAQFVILSLNTQSNKL